MKRLISLCLSFFLLVVMLPAFSVQQAEAADFSEESIRSILLSFESRYPEGTPYDNSDFYAWQGGIFSGGYGCSGFAFMLSDAAFGSLPARKYYDYSQIRVGDILRLYNGGHSVIVLYVNAEGVTIAEGNYNGKVHWYRTLSMSEIEKSNLEYAITRYPEDMPKSSLKGDINDDSVISTDDAQLALQAYVNTLSGQPADLTAEQIARGDIDDNNTLDIVDAQYILIYYSENVLAKRGLTWTQIINSK